MTNPIPSSPSLSPLQLKLQAKLAEIRAAKQLVQSTAAPTLTQAANEQLSTPASSPTSINCAIPDGTESTLAQGTDRFGQTITYNSRQSEAIQLIAAGSSCVVIGAAGTGKTTIQKGSTAALIASGSVGRVGPTEHKYLNSKAYGVAICAYTRRATNNIRKNLSEDLQSSCLTLHKLLEYQPVECYVPDLKNGGEKKSMRFEATRNALNPLPPTITTIIIEESSMVSYELFMELSAACPHNPQFVFLGDIQQLPPVFGSAILGYKMLELPVVELTEVYRQALESPILSLAHRILSGTPITKEQLTPMSVPNKLTLHPWKKRISADSATETLAKFFLKAIDQGKYNPETDGILIPFNKSCGTDELNKHIATKIAAKEYKPVFEIIHGWKKSYYSVGDKCLYEREDAIIKSIVVNPQYVGVMPREESYDIDYWGNGGAAASADDIDQFLSNVSAGTGEEDGEKKFRAASHIITLQLLDSERQVTIKSAGEIDALILGYAITVHKSQGSEWPKVFLCLHQSHAVMIQRELLYTAVTRAKEELFCICEPDTFDKGIVRQRIKGSTWQEKAEYFKGKLENGELQS